MADQPTTRGTHQPQTLGNFTGQLMILDIDDIEIGDLIFYSGHLIRQVVSTPRDQSYRQDHNWTYRVYHVAKVGPDAVYSPPSRFQTAEGTAMLVLRPTKD